MASMDSNQRVIPSDIGGFTDRLSNLSIGGAGIGGDPGMAPSAPSKASNPKKKYGFLNDLKCRLVINSLLIFQSLFTVNAIRLSDLLSGSLSRISLNIPEDSGPFRVSTIGRLTEILNLTC